VSAPKQGEIWWAELESARRPVLVVTRTEAVPVLTGIVVAPVTRTIRSIPSEIRLGADEGLDTECVANFDSVQRIQRTALTTKLGDLGVRRSEICAALETMSNC
jgi:mRNA interferase MazF